MSKPDATWIAAGSLADLPPGGRKLVFVPGHESVLVLNVEGAVFAMENSCPHAGASMASGACQGHVLSCPAHGLRVDIRTGQCTTSPTMQVPTYGVAQVDGALWLQPPSNATATPY